MKIKKYQKNFDHSYTLGAFPTLELLTKKPKVVEQVFYSAKAKRSQAFDKIIALCDELGIRYEENDRIVNTLGREDTYFVGVFSKYESKLKSGESIVLLYHPSDLGNLGTIMRTCLGFGIKNVAIIEPATDIFDPKVIRSSMGALFSLNFMHFREIEEFKEYYDQPMYILDIKGEKDISSVKFEKPCTLVFGNEGKGVEDKVLSLGTPVRISHRDDIDSLNLAVSVGIALYAYSESK